MHKFLPVTAQEMKDRGWDQVDFVYLTGDAYVEHNAAQLAKVCTHLIGGAHIGLTDNLDKRDSAAVIVNICTLGGVKELSGIFLNMYPCYADFFGALRCFHG